MELLQDSIDPGIDDHAGPPWSGGLGMDLQLVIQWPCERQVLQLRRPSDIGHGGEECALDDGAQQDVGREAPGLGPGQLLEFGHREALMAPTALESTRRLHQAVPTSCGLDHDE
jgi:hypothetical protein